MIGTNFKIWDNCFIAIGTGEVIIGNDGLLGVNTYINASQGRIIIGNNVAIAPFCQLYSYTHHYYAGLLISESFKASDVIIEDDVLIGANSVILPGVRIGKGAIIGSGSVVTSNVEESHIVGGVPAKFIKTRGE
jgi:acetyltransferase-like isoleucine patch superfamily enzyme